jgi:hypothetical protein
VIVGLVALALVVGLGTWLAVDRWSWQTYPGSFEEARVRLDHPRAWAARSHPGQFAVLSPTDLTPSFTPESTWPEIRQLAASDPDKVVGAYVDTTGWLNIGSVNQPLQDQVVGQFATFAKIEPSAGIPAGTPAGAQGLVATMISTDGSASPRLYVEFVALGSGARQGHILLFCLEGDKAKYAKTFQRVLESARLA